MTILSSIKAFFKKLTGEDIGGSTIAQAINAGTEAYTPVDPEPSGAQIKFLYIDADKTYLYEDSECTTKVTKNNFLTYTGTSIVRITGNTGSTMYSPIFAGLRGLGAEECGCVLVAEDLDTGSGLTMVPMLLYTAEYAGPEGDG